MKADESPKSAAAAVSSSSDDDERRRRNSKTEKMVEIEPEPEIIQPVEEPKVPAPTKIAWHTKTFSDQ